MSAVVHYTILPEPRLYLAQYLQREGPIKFMEPEMNNPNH
jgi:hypothetical protein